MSKLFLYGSVGEDPDWTNDRSFDAVSVKKDLEDITELEPLDIELNSFGGYVADAIAIKSLIEKHQGPVNINIAGICASAATLITCAKNAKVSMSKGSLFMIHNPSCLAYGTKHDLKPALESLEKQGEEIINIYKEKTNLDEKTLSKLMDAETWLTCEEALEKGFIDAVNDQSSVSMNAKDNILTVNGICFSLKNFKHIPKNINMESNEMKDTKDNSKENHKISNCEELQALYPELCKEMIKNAVAEAIKNERSRLQELDELMTDANASIINKAKYESFETAKDCALKILRAQKNKKAELLQNRIEDANEVLPIATPQNNDSHSEKDNVIANITNLLNK